MPFDGSLRPREPTPEPSSEGRTMAWLIVGVLVGFGLAAGIGAWIARGLPA